jgi:hypothetical protein
VRDADALTTGGPVDVDMVVDGEALELGDT